MTGKVMLESLLAELIAIRGTFILDNHHGSMEFRGDAASAVLSYAGAVGRIHPRLVLPELLRLPEGKGRHSGEPENLRCIHRRPRQ